MKNVIPKTGRAH